MMGQSFARAIYPGQALHPCNNSPIFRLLQEWGNPPNKNANKVAVLWREVAIMDKSLKIVPKLTIMTEVDDLDEFLW